MTPISTGNNNNNNNNSSFEKQTNKQTNKRIEAASRIYKGFFFYNEDLELLERIEELRRRDGWNFSDFAKAAFTEYIDRHFPGNPGLPLTHWITGEPLSEAASEKLQAQTKPKPKPLPDFLTMTDQELLNFYNSPRTLYEDRVIAAYHLKTRGISVEEMRKMRESRLPQ
jgi:hypothetical protein